MRVERLWRNFRTAQHPGIPLTPPPPRSPSPSSLYSLALCAWRWAQRSPSGVLACSGSQTSVPLRARSPVSARNGVSAWIGKRMPGCGFLPSDWSDGITAWKSGPTFTSSPNMASEASSAQLLVSSERGRSAGVAEIGMSKSESHSGVVLAEYLTHREVLQRAAEWHIAG